MIHGFLTIDKPAGMTSHDVVARIRRVSRQRRVGHGGTLDPAATGVLPIALGEATRLVDYLVEGSKTYHATVRLGVTTATDDAEGEVIEERPVPALDRAAIQAALRPFVGTIAQIPPMYSAIQVGGQRLYDLARRGETIERTPRQVTIERIDLDRVALPLLDLRIVCGKGTYIRAIARDLGAALGCGATLETLRRTAVGPLRIEDAVPLDRLLSSDSAITPESPSQPSVLLADALLPPDTAIADWPLITLDDSATARLRNGLPIARATTGALARAHAPDGSLLALLRADDDVWRPFKVFRWAE